MWDGQGAAEMARRCAPYNLYLMQGNLCSGNPRYGIHVGAFQTGISLCGNMCVDNGYNLSLMGDYCSSTGDFCLGYNDRLSRKRAGARLLGKGNTVTGLVARGNPYVNVNASGVDLSIVGGVIGCEDDQETGIGMEIRRPSEDYRIAPAVRMRIRDVLFTGCQTAVRVGGVVEDIRLTGNRFQGNARNVEVAEECRAQVALHRNEGYVTENRGAARIESPSKSVTVLHGLDVTPQLCDISVTATNDLGKASKFWVRAPNETGFEISVDADPGPNGADFVWRVEAGGHSRSKIPIVPR